ncbi:MAG: diacylglycerol kinase [Alphaproteobacteria bacterium]|nr:diacylglycerol kinase [Alphaproteobacteria bacterium]
MKDQSFVNKLRFAAAGLAETWKRESNFRREVWISLAVLALLIVLRPAPVWWAIVVIVIVLVLGTELLNSAVEALADHLHPERHPEIRTVKDMLAGLVLLVALGAGLVGLLLLLAQLDAAS